MTREYVVTCCIGDIITYKQTFINKHSAIRYATSSKFDGCFTIVETYVIPDGMLYCPDAKLINSIVFYAGEKVESYKRKVTVKDLRNLESTIPRIIHVDGSHSFIKSTDLATAGDVDELLGGQFEIRIVQDNAPRKAILFVDWHSIDTLLPINKKASELFGMTLRGDVIYTPEAFIE